MYCTSVVQRYIGVSVSYAIGALILGIVDVPLILVMYFVLNLPVGSSIGACLLLELVIGVVSK